MKRKKVFRKIMVTLLILMMLVSQVVYAESDPYALANRYFKIKSVSNGQYLLGNNAGYEAQASSAEEAISFYLKPSGLGTYILYDSDSKWLNINFWGAIIRNKDRQASIQWQIDPQDDGSMSLYSVTRKAYVGIDGTSLVFKDTLDPSCLFYFEASTGDNPFPEASTNVTISDSDGKTVSPAEAMARPGVGEMIIGYADTHAHLNHFLGSGQSTFTGKTFDPLGITEALKDCTDLHGINGSYDLWGQLVDGATTHNTSGYPSFDYWPTSYSTDHQQTYYKWLERSWLAGQRVFVQQCVNNATLGGIKNALPPYANGPIDDMTVAQLQIDNVYAMQDYIDAQCGGPGQGWFRIVTSPSQARQVISQGKMAVFLSFEFDTVFGADRDYIGDYQAGRITKDECDQALQGIENQLDSYYAQGIRSVFPVHALNNGFGGCQLYQGELFSIMNYLNRGDFYQPEVSTNPRVFYRQPKADLPEAQGHGNVEGLTQTGEWLINQLIERKYIIEVDHMSDKTFNATLDILWEQKYPGVIASHTRILDMFEPEDEAWEQMDIPRMIKIMQLGGIISPMLWETLDEHQKCVADYLDYMIDLSSDGLPKIGTLDNPKYQHYGGPYDVPTTWYNTNSDPSDDMILGIPYGSDVNGACMLPNFDNVEGVYTPVNYDDGSFSALYDGIYSDEVSSVLFDRQKTGDRVFDINGDRGVAHYGLLPDLIKMFESRPDRVNIDATFHGAEAYIRMLERVENYSDSYPSRNSDEWLTVDTEYWHK